MRERLTTAALALAALLLFLTIFVHAEGPSTAGASLPTSVDREDNGLLGALSWLEEEGVRTRAVRERFTTLAGMRDLPARGNLLVVTLPAAVPLRSDEADALDRWVRAGNTVLVLASLSDRPSWAHDPGVLNSDLRLLTGLDLEHAERRAPARSRSGARRNGTFGRRGASPVAVPKAAIHI